MGDEDSFRLLKNLQIRHFIYLLNVISGETSPNHSYTIEKNQAL